MRWSLITLPAILLATGCGGDDLPETYAVTGNVTLDGSPVEGADVVLVPSNPEVRSAGGQTDAQGNFTVKTYFGPKAINDGAMQGDYAVTVSKVEMKQAPAGLNPEAEMAWYTKNGATKPLLPAKYDSPKTSGFKTTVGPDTAATPLKLELKK